MKILFTFFLVHFAFCFTGYWSQTLSGSLGKRKRLLLFKTTGYRNSMPDIRTGEWTCKNSVKPV